MSELVKNQLSHLFFLLFISLLFFIFLKNLKIPISIISFVNDGLFISQNKSISHLNTNLFCSYNVISSLLTKLGLIVEHRKTEVFHFSRSHGAFNPPPLDLTTFGGLILLPKASWQYLGFFFDQELTFQHHIEFYTNKLISTRCKLEFPRSAARSDNRTAADSAYGFPCRAFGNTLVTLCISGDNRTEISKNVHR